MARLTVVTMLSMDGVMQAPGGADEDREGGFEHGGWAVPYLDEELIGLAKEATLKATALLVGRKTYDIFAAAWPLAGPDDPIGAKMNSVRKYVASRTLDTVSWQNSTLLTGDVAAAVGKLKAGGDGDIQVHGSGGLVQTLLAHDLVDEFRLLVFPVVIGSGKRLFGTGTLPRSMTPTGSITSRTGVTIGTYVRGGELRYGAIGPETGNWNP